MTNDKAQMSRRTQNNNSVNSLKIIATLISKKSLLTSLFLREGNTPLWQRGERVDF
jgi:hypothetical protein